MTWVLWDKQVDATFRPDFQTLTGETISNPVITLGKKFLHYSENLSKEAIENIGNLYSGYVIFRMELFGWHHE